MLKTQEIEIDGVQFTLREPRIKDHMRAMASLEKGADAYAMAMLSSMLLNDMGQEVGEAFVEELPMRVFSQLAQAMEDFRERPLDSTGAPSSV